MIADPDRKIADAYGVDSIPHNVFVDRSGTIQQVIVDFDEGGLERAAKQAVGAG